MKSYFREELSAKSNFERLIRYLREGLLDRNKASESNYLLGWSEMWRRS